MSSKKKRNHEDLNWNSNSENEEEENKLELENLLDLVKILIYEHVRRRNQFMIKFLS